MPTQIQLLASPYTRLRQLKWSEFCTFTIALVALGYLLVATFPGEYKAIDLANLDPCWVYALNYLANSTYLFGRDVVFTYGPLGYLMLPMHCGSNMMQGMSFMVAIHILWAVALAICIRATKNKAQFCLFVLCYALMFAFKPEYQEHLLCVMLLLCFLPSRLGKPKGFVGVLAGIFAAVLFLTKFNVACAALLTMVLATISWKLEFGSLANRLILTTYASFAICLTLLSSIYLRSFSNFSRGCKVQSRLLMAIVRR